MRTLIGRAAEVAAAGAAAMLAACGLTLEERPNLELVCQIRPCVCLAEKVEPFAKRATAEVQWRQNGDAYCPDGFVLRLVREP